MKVVILQPSYIPWRGYFDQICRADLFIFYDDVQYDKHGWRNRNRIKTAQGNQWLTIPVHSRGVTDGVSIKNIRIDWSKPWAKNHFKALTFAYSKAPYFKKYSPLIESFYSRHDEMLSDFTIATTEILTRTLGIMQTRFISSSEIEGITGQKTDRLIQILASVGASHYISGPSAREYIEQEKFEKAGIMLEYINYEFPLYDQLYTPFEPFVSILDLLFMTGEAALDYINITQKEKLNGS
jgi:hypothetical protein